MRDVTLTLTGEEARAALDAIEEYNRRCWTPPGEKLTGPTVDVATKLHAAIYDDQRPHSIAPAAIIAAAGRIASVHGLALETIQQFIEHRDHLGMDEPTAAEQTARLIAAAVTIAKARKPPHRPNLGAPHQ